MTYHDEMFFEGATPAGMLSFTDDSVEIDFQPSPKAQAQALARRSHRLATVLSITGAILAGLFINVDVAHAGNGHPHGSGTTLSITKQVPLAYDALWKLKNPGGPVEINPQPLPPRYLSNTHVNPGDIVGFNPQPDPPGFM